MPALAGSDPIACRIGIASRSRAQAAVLNRHVSRACQSRGFFPRPTRIVKKTISSPFTFFFKFVFPALWVAIGLFVLFRSVLDPNTKDLFLVILFLIVWTGVPTLINYWNNFPLKRVHLDDSLLYVSNYVEEITIPLSSIDDVQASAYPWMGWWRWPPYRIVITLKNPSEFGEKILIIPGFYYKDVVNELRNAMDAQSRRS